MRNSVFFDEAKIIANYALKYKDSTGRGIEMGVKHLKQLRYDPNTAIFTEHRFSLYAEHYAKLAREMVQEYKQYQRACNAGVFDRD
jgi:hypothetical protein